MFLAAMTVLSLAAAEPRIAITEVSYDQTDVTYTEAFYDCARGLRPSFKSYRIEHPSRFPSRRGLVEVVIAEPELWTCHIAGDLVETEVTFRVSTRSLDGRTYVPGLNFAADYDLRINGTVFGHFSVGLVGDQQFFPVGD